MDLKEEIRTDSASLLSLLPKYLTGTTQRRTDLLWLMVRGVRPWSTNPIALGGAEPQDTSVWLKKVAQLMTARKQRESKVPGTKYYTQQHTPVINFLLPCPICLPRTVNLSNY